jgi:hypothetical protein
MSAVRIDLGAKGDGREQRQLVGGVVAADVEGRVGFGIAELLCRREAVLEREAFLLHPGQDVVRGAVEDAVDAVDRVAGHRLAERLDDRDAAGCRRLEIQADALSLGLPRQRDAMGGKERLVGGDDVLAGIDRRLDRSRGRPLRAADQLDEDVRAGIAGQPDRIVEPGGARDVDAAIACAIPRRDAGDGDRPAGADRKIIAMAVDQAHQRRSDRTEPGDAEAKGSVHRNSVNSTACHPGRTAAQSVPR